jgi:hypothetical protein
LYVLRRAAPGKIGFVISYHLHLLPFACSSCVGIVFQSGIKAVALRFPAPLRRGLTDTNIDVSFDFHNRIYIVLQRKAPDGTTLTSGGRQRERSKHDEAG